MRHGCEMIARKVGVNDPHIAIVWQTANQIADAIAALKEPTASVG